MAMKKAPKPPRPFEPTLAATLKDAEVQFPVLGSPKLDGIRCIVKDGKAVARSLLPIPNHHTRNLLESYASLTEGLDGELMSGTEFNKTQSAVMTEEGEPEFVFNVFDIIHCGEGYADRYDLLKRRPLPNFCKVVEHKLITDMDSLMLLHEEHMSLGYEGTMLRSLTGRYKYGRSTVKEGILLRIKPLEDSEAVIYGFEEMMHNENEKVTNELGRSKRSTHAAGMVPANTLGNFLVRGTEAEHFGGVEFSIGGGIGLTQELRKQVWDNREAYLGKLIKFRYQKIGSLEKPRIPKFVGFRNRVDMS